MNEDLKSRTYELPNSYIYSLAEAMFDFSSQEDLRNWLEAKEKELWLRRCEAMGSVRFLI